VAHGAHVAEERPWRNLSLPEVLRARDLPSSGFDNHSASSVKENANKNKVNRFYFLLFVLPNRDFSKGYEQKNKKICLAYDSPSRLCARRSAPALSLLLVSSLLTANVRQIPDFRGRKYTEGSRIRQGFVGCNLQVA
jgi:hypothetical protein